MGVEQELNKLRAVSNGCSLAAFADLRTKLVLRVSAESDWPQERLDALCSQAAQSFRQADSEVLRKAGLARADGPTREAVILSAQEIRVFVRSEDDPSDMICCVCRSAEDVPALAQAAHQALRAI
ncbi:MAG: hypothetical protein AB3N11_04995 [Arenibacterium sp.]